MSRTDNYNEVKKDPHSSWAPPTESSALLPLSLTGCQGQVRQGRSLLVKSMGTNNAAVAVTTLMIKTVSRGETEEKKVFSHNQILHYKLCFIKRIMSQKKTFFV